MAGLMQAQSVRQSRSRPGTIRPSVEARRVERQPVGAGKYQCVIGALTNVGAPVAQQLSQDNRNGVVRREVRVLGAIDPASGSHDSRTLIVPAARSTAPHRSARSSPYRSPEYSAVAHTPRSSTGKASINSAATSGARISTSRESGAGSSRSRVGLAPLRELLRGDRSPGAA